MHESQAVARPPRPRPFRILRRYWRAVLIIIIALWSYGFFSLGQYSVYRAHPELSQADQANLVLAQVGKLIQLPADETPRMAVVKDAASAKEAQPFLANAANGDVLIVYPQAGEAILYRPSTDKLIAVGPVHDQPSSGTQAITPPASAATTTANNNKTSTVKK